jgi:sortase A
MNTYVWRSDRRLVDARRITGQWLGGEAMVTLPPVHTPLRWRVAAWCRRVRKRMEARRFVALLGAALTLWGLGAGGYIHAKAAVAQTLLRSAWTRSLASGVAQKPWPWADTWPVARLTVPRLAVDEIVLAGASGRTLAFGPALSTAAAQPGDVGNAIVSAHRDTHFAFLQHVSVGDRVWLETARGRYAYEIEGTSVVDSRDTRIATRADEARLTLVTCWPFDAMRPGGPMRFVVNARLVATLQRA